jgi:hypothetical protein
MIQRMLRIKRNDSVSTGRFTEVAIYSVSTGRFTLFGNYSVSTDRFTEVAICSVSTGRFTVFGNYIVSTGRFTEVAIYSVSTGRFTVFGNYSVSTGRFTIVANSSYLLLLEKLRSKHLRISLISSSNVTCNCGLTWLQYCRTVFIYVVLLTYSRHGAASILKS